MYTCADFLKQYNDNEYIAKMHINKKTKTASTYHFSTSSLTMQPDIDNSMQMDMYLSINPMKFLKEDNKWNINRDKKHVARLKFCYVDLDTYHTEYSTDQILLNLTENYFRKIIPEPTHIIESGRGLYLLWLVDEHVKAYSRWKAVQEFLYKTLKEFGADSSVVSDSARVFRAIGSVNSKSGKVVTRIGGTGMKYTLYEIMEEYAPGMADRFKAPKRDKKKKGNKNEQPGKKTANKGNKIVFFNSPVALLKARMDDLVTLLTEYRDYEGSMRENILFLYRYWHLCVNEDKQAALDDTLALNSKLSFPLTEHEIIKATKSAEKAWKNDQKYKFSTQGVIDFLAINEEEQKSMKVLTGRKIRKERKRESNRNAYLRRLKNEGKDTKADATKDRLKALYRLLNDGIDREEICNRLDISKSTYYRETAKIKEMSEAELQELKNAEIVDFAGISADSQKFSPSTLEVRSTDGTRNESEHPLIQNTS